MNSLRTVSLFGATLANGLMAGLFFAYSVSVMPGLAKTDARTFVDAMRRINVAILNGWFFLVFVGALLLTLAAAALRMGHGQRPVLWWVVAALVLYVVVLAATSAINVPLNDQLAAAGDADLAGARADFEDCWVVWNNVRTVCSIGAFACLAWASTVSDH